MTVIKLQNWERAVRDLWIYVFLLSLVYVLYVLRNYIRAVILAFKLDGPPSLPVIGNCHLFFSDEIYGDVMRKKVQTNRIMRVWISAMPFILITEPKDIQTVFGSMKHNRKSFVYSLFRSLFGDGLVVNEDEVWKQHRRIIHSAFNSNGLERFIKIFAKYAEYLSVEFLDQLDKDINITKTVNDIVYSIQSEAILGMKTRKNYTEEEEDLLPFKRNQQFGPYRLLRPWLLVEGIYKMTNTSKKDWKQRENHSDIVHRVLKETEKSMRKNSCNIEQDENGKRTTKWTSLLEYMIQMKEKHPQFTDEDIVSECCTFMLAGMETVSTATAITLFLLANNKEWQDKCVDELNTILNDNDSTLTFTKTLNELKCLEMCIKESLRLFPSIPLMGRRLNEDEILGGYVVPAGCNIFLSPYVTHRLTHYYSDPESFKPERFDPTNSDEKIYPGAYIPFSIGPRNCIGQKFAMFEMKILISTILRNFVLEPVKGKNAVEMKYRMTLRAHGGLWIRFKARTKKT